MIAGGAGGQAWAPALHNLMPRCPCLPSRSMTDQNGQTFTAKKLSGGPLVAWGMQQRSLRCGLLGPKPLTPCRFPGFPWRRQVGAGGLRPADQLRRRQGHQLHLQVPASHPAPGRNVFFFTAACLTGWKAHPTAFTNQLLPASPPGAGPLRRRSSARAWLWHPSSCRSTPAATSERAVGVVGSSGAGPCLPCLRLPGSRAGQARRSPCCACLHGARALLHLGKAVGAPPRLSPTGVTPGPIPLSQG